MFSSRLLASFSSILFKFSALEEDAIACVERLNKSIIGGATLTVTLASDKGNTPAVAKDGKKVAKIKGSKVLGVPDVLKPRTMVITGFTSEIDKKVIWVRVRKNDGVVADQFKFPVTLPGSEGLVAAVVGFDTKENRNKAIKKLDGHEVHKCKLVARPAEQILLNEQSFKNSRLIVRNIPFTARPSHIRNALERKGFPLASLSNIKMPMKYGGDGHAVEKFEAKEQEEKTLVEQGKEEEQKEPVPAGADNGDDSESDDEDAASSVKPKAENRGFAFLEFITKLDAEKAISTLNEQKVHKRRVAVDWVVDAATAKQLNETDNEEGNDNGDDNANRQEDDKESVVSQEEDKNDKEAEDGTDSEDVSSNNDDNTDDSGSESDGEDDSDDEDGENEEEKKKQKEIDMADALLGTTLFVRNLSFDTKDADLVSAFRLFGPVKYARVVVDKSTGRSKGSGFVQYYTKRGADNALRAAGASDEHSEVVTLPANATPEQKRAFEFNENNINAAMLDGGIKVAGRALLITRALTKDDVEKLEHRKMLQQDGAFLKEGKKFCKRHLYLSHEGVIRSNSEAAKNTPEADMKKREESYKAARAKLRSPLFFVSPVRLSIRNLARSVDDTKLKALVKQAALKGLEMGLVDRNEGDPRLMPAPGEPIPKIGIVRAYVMREKLEEALGMTGGPKPKHHRPRYDEDGITLRSKGFGFASFEHHIHALAALRYLNNNPDFAHFAQGGAQAKSNDKPENEVPRLIVEFTVENIAEVKKHEKKVQEREARRKSMEEAGIRPKKRSRDEADGDSGDGKNNKRRKQDNKKGQEQTKTSDKAFVKKNVKIIKGNKPKNAKPARTEKTDFTEVIGAPDRVTKKRVKFAPTTKDSADPELDRIVGSKTSMAESGNKRRRAGQGARTEERKINEIESAYKKKVASQPAAVPKIEFGSISSKWL